MRVVPTPKPLWRAFRLSSGRGAGDIWAPGQSVEHLQTWKWPASRVGPGEQGGCGTGGWDQSAGSRGAGRGVSSPRPGWDSSRGSDTFTLWLRRGLRMGVRWGEQEMAPRPGGSMGGAEPGGCQAPSRTWVWTSPASSLLGPHCLWHRLSVPSPLSLPSHRTRPSARESRGGRYLSQGPSSCGGLRL